MTAQSKAKLVLLSLALVALGCAETVWSLALSKNPGLECLGSASGADAALVEVEAAGALASLEVRPGRSRSPGPCAAGAETGTQ
jgi:hypothetical protein